MQTLCQGNRKFCCIHFAMCKTKVINDNLRRSWVLYILLLKSNKFLVIIYPQGLFGHSYQFPGPFLIFLFFFPKMETKCQVILVDVYL